LKLNLKLFHVILYSGSHGWAHHQISLIQIRLWSTRCLPLRWQSRAFCQRVANESRKRDSKLSYRLMGTSLSLLKPMEWCTMIENNLVLAIRTRELWIWKRVYCTPENEQYNWNLIVFLLLCNPPSNDSTINLFEYWFTFYRDEITLEIALFLHSPDRCISACSFWSACRSECAPRRRCYRQCSQRRAMRNIHIILQKYDLSNLQNGVLKIILI